MREIARGMAAVIIFLVSVFSIPCETLKGLHELAAYAVENNIEYRTAAFEYKKALGNLEYPLKLNESDVSFLTSYSFIESEGYSSKVIATIPIINQLQFTASVNRILDGNIGVTFFPLDHSDSREQAEISSRAAWVYLRELTILTTGNAVSAVLEWTSAVRNFEIFKDFIRVKKNIYEDEKQRYKLGDADLDDVREALLNWSGTRISLVTAQNRLHQAESELYSVLNANPDSINIEMISMDELNVALEEIKNTINSEELSVEDTWSVLSSKSEVDSIRAKLDSTWLFDPDLGISAGLDYKMGSLRAADTSLTITVSVSDWQADEISEMEASLSLTEDMSEQSLAVEKINLEQALIVLETTKINREIAIIELEQADELVGEAEFLYSLGDYSDTEQEEILLTRRQVENSLFSAFSAEYNAWQGLRIYTMY